MCITLTGKIRLDFFQQGLKCADISSFFTDACLMAFSCRSELLFQRAILARSLKDSHLCSCEEQFIHLLNGADGGKCFWNLLKCKCKSSTLYPRISCNDSVWTLMIQKYVLSPSQPTSNSARMCCCKSFTALCSLTLTSVNCVWLCVALHRLLCPQSLSCQQLFCLC